MRRAGFRAIFQRHPAREPVIDGVRAIAVLWVLILHILFFHFGTFPDFVQNVFTGPFTRWIARGDMGVDLFFIISGILIGGILLREHQKSNGINLRRFYGRRIMRLMPVYLVVMLMGVYFLRDIPRAAILADINPTGNVENAWANILYVNNFLSVRDQYMGWCWSLAIEEQFYLVAPLLILLLIPWSKRPALWLLAAFLFSGWLRFALILYLDVAPPFTDTPDADSWVRRFNLIYIKPYARYGGLVLGVLSAYLTLHHRDRVRSFLARPWLTDTLVLGGLVICIVIACISFRSEFFTSLRNWSGNDVLGQLYYAHHRDVFAVAIVLLINAAVEGQGNVTKAVRRILSARFWFPIAQLSYSIYLLHEMYMLWLFPKLAPMLAQNLGLPEAFVVACDGLVVCVMTVSSAAVLFVLVEYPCMVWRKSTWFERLVGAGPEDQATKKPLATEH
ncbi:MAG: acyltransferase [Planctomycetota bacterium]